MRSISIAFGQLIDQLYLLDLEESLDILSEIIPFNRQKFKTGDKIYDWTIPKEWKVNKAYIIDPNGKKMRFFQK